MAFANKYTKYQNNICIYFELFIEIMVKLILIFL